MSSISDIKDWLSIRASALITGTVPASVSAYVGQSDRVAPAAFECQVKYLSTVPVRRANQLHRHEFDLVVKAIGHDITDEDVLSGAVDDALALLEAGIDADAVSANSGMTSVHVDRVRAFRSGPMDVKDRMDRRASLRVEVDELKGGV